MTSVTMYNSWLGYPGNPAAMNAYLNNSGGYADGCLIYWAATDDLNYCTYYVFINFLKFELTAFHRLHTQPLIMQQFVP